MGTCAPSRPPYRLLLGALPQPCFLCGVLLRMMSLVAVMHLGKLCVEVRADSWGGEQSSLLLVVMLLLLLLVVVDVVVVLDVLVFVAL